MAKGLNSLDYEANIKQFLSKELFLLLKKGKNAFPMDKRIEAANFDADFRAWMLDVCKAQTETAATRIEALEMIKQASVEELSAMRLPIATLKDSLAADYQKLLLSVSKASQHIPNPVLSSMLVSIGVAKAENQYYKQVHDALFSIQKGVEGSLTGALQRIDRTISNKRNAAMRNARQRNNAAAAARHQAAFNAQGARLGLPPGTSPLNVLTAWKNKVAKGGTRKQKGGAVCTLTGFKRGQQMKNMGSVYTVSNVRGRSTNIQRKDLVLKYVVDSKTPQTEDKEYDNDAWKELEIVSYVAEHGLTPRVLAKRYCGLMEHVECTQGRNKDPELDQYPGWTGSFVQEKVVGDGRRVPEDVKKRLLAELRAIGIRAFDDNDSNFLYGSTTSHPGPKWWLIDFGFARFAAGGKRSKRTRRK